MRQFETVMPAAYPNPAGAWKPENPGADRSRPEMEEERQDFMGMEACPITKRVMIVSPFPASVQSLIHSLSAACYDLFTLHDYDASMVRSLQPELLIYDANPYAYSHQTADEALREAIEQTSHVPSVPVLYLVDERASLSLSGLPDSSELLLWPARPQEAMYRINKLIMKQQAAGLVPEMTFKDLKIDPRKMAVYRAGVRVDLTKTEYELLMLFVKSDGSVLSREAIFDGLWGSQFFGNSNVVDAHIKSLRKKLKDSAVSPKYIVTVRGAGYRLADERKE
ncbi:winged-helix domain-containing protein [Paenibacillus thailandensis]|uniref:Winged-helix domain-containing protein n=1 Tax=Paenibacillus thailandensis TaxID=393250 RepID=A0ABW5R569_9BACL